MGQDPQRSRVTAGYPARCQLLIIAAVNSLVSTDTVRKLRLLPQKWWEQQTRHHLASDSRSMPVVQAKTNENCVCAAQAHAAPTAMTANRRHNKCILKLTSASFTDNPACTVTADAYSRGWRCQPAGGEQEHRMLCGCAAAVIKYKRSIY